MYPFWKGRPGNINLVSVRVFDFVHLERRADVAGRHRLQTRAPWAGVPAQVTLSKSLNLSAKCQQQHPPRKFPVRIKWGKCHEAPRAGSDGLLHPNLFLRVLPGLEKLRGVVAEDWAGAKAGHFLGCVTISPHVYREWGDKVERKRLALESDLRL